MHIGGEAEHGARLPLQPLLAPRLAHQRQAEGVQLLREQFELPAALGQRLGHPVGARLGLAAAAPLPEGGPGEAGQGTQGGEQKLRHGPMLGHVG
ncbi:hypothetical protein [Teichococcus cervicalis]|uniref:hypothetical protein n=1 Tax=Teichococcus cervicalis TaxID=204525 RepID=UPI0036D2A12E